MFFKRSHVLRIHFFSPSSSLFASFLNESNVHNKAVKAFMLKTRDLELQRHEQLSGNKSVRWHGTGKHFNIDTNRLRRDTE